MRRTLLLSLVLFAFAGVALGQTGSVPYDGTCLDADDGDISTTISWNSDLQGVLGTGDSGSFDLVEGIHIVTPTCSDSYGNVSGAIDPGDGTFVPLACIFDDGQGGFTFLNPCEIQITVTVDDPPILTIRSPVDGATYQD